MLPWPITWCLKSIQRTIIPYGECLGVIHREEVAILAELIGNMDRLYWFLDGKPLHQPLDEIVTHESRRNWGEKLFLAAHGYPVLRVLHLPHQPLHLVEGARPVNAWLLFLLLIIRGLHRDRGGPLRRWQELWRYRWRRGLGSWAGDGSTRTPWGSSPIPSLQSPPHAHRRFRAV